MPLQPDQLAAEHFQNYPEEARKQAVDNLVLLRRLPPGFISLLLRELILFDYKFPAEREEVERQFRYLAGLSAADLLKAMAPFSQLHLSADLERADWVNSPAAYSESLTAHLWTSHQIDAFRAAAIEYVRNVGMSGKELPLLVPRLCIVAMSDSGGERPLTKQFPIFGKLAPHGTLFTRVTSENGLQPLLGAVVHRATSHPAPYGHWCIDGGNGLLPNNSEVANVSYGALKPVRMALANRMQKTYEGGVFDPEAFRSMLARTQPEEIGFDDVHDRIMTRFQLSVLTEGSGTQVFSTTFVQWSAREALRRAQPLTMFVRFAARQRERPMNELLAESQRVADLDPEGSLIDAAQGAYYTWMNQQRLPGAEQAMFLAWYGEQVVAVGPSFERGKRIDVAISLRDLIERVV